MQLFRFVIGNFTILIIIARPTQKIIVRLRFAFFSYTQVEDTRVVPIPIRRIQVCQQLLRLVYRGIIV